MINAVAFILLTLAVPCTEWDNPSAIYLNNFATLNDETPDCCPAYVQPKTAWLLPANPTPPDTVCARTFDSEDELNRFLSKNPSSEATVFDVRAGQQFDVSQKPVTREITTTKTVIESYKFILHPRLVKP